jgi:regulator of protease activity HflC (stomatin/prohibitin superfamily)
MNLVQFNQNVRDPREHPWLFLSLTVLWLLMLIAALIWSSFNWTAPETDGFTIPAGKMVAGLAVAWLVFSVRALQTDEIGAVTLFGLPLIKVGRGPKVIIAGLLQLERFTSKVRQNQFPAEPELIQKTDDSEPLRMVQFTYPDGTIVERMTVRPLRITTRSPYTENDPGYARYKGHILNVQMVVEFTFWVRWIIVDPFQFMISGGGDDNIALQQLRDAGESYLNQEVVKRIPAELIDEFTGLEQGLSDHIKAKITAAAWGIEVVEVGLTAPDLSHALSASMRDIAMANATAQKKLIDAKADASVTVVSGNAAAEVIERTGAAQGVAREKLLVGEARGINRSAKLIGVPAEQVLAATIARETVGEGDLILGVEGITQAVGIGNAILKKKEG